MKRFLVVLAVISGCKKAAPPDFGNVACWGNDRAGELGSVDERDQAKPRRVAGFEGATALQLTDMATCAVMPSGPIKCVGDLLDLGHFESATPLTAIPDAIEVRTGTLFGCALRKTGQVACWGANLVGQLGNGAAPDPKTQVLIKVDGSTVTTPPIPGAMSSKAVAVTGLDDATHLAAGKDHACAIRRDGHVVCWGLDSDGQLGDGRTGRDTTSDHPVEVLNVTDATAIAASQTATCAIAKGGVWCWGSLAEWHASPEPTWTQPTKLDGVDGAVELAMDETEACARTSAGAAICWSATSKPGPRDLGHVVQLGGGFRHLCARLDSGQLKCWGDDLNSQTGEHDNGGPVKGIEHATEVGVGGSHTCVRF